MNHVHNIAYIGIGSNLNDPDRQVCLAIERINEHDAIECLQTSHFYSSKPVAAGVVNQEQAAQQPDYVNAVVQVRTHLTARLLLDALLLMENQHGRLRLIKGAARTVDLDLLVYGQESIEEPGLLVPHPRIAERAFVLVPLHDISPKLVIPGLGDLSSLLEKCDKSDLQLIRKNCASAIVNTDI